MKKITIHFDFTTGEEVPYSEGLKLQEFKTHCVSFFRGFTNDVTIVKKDGSYINNLELLKNTGEYTQKEISISHNITKIFIAGGFLWKPYNDPTAGSVKRCTKCQCGKSMDADSHDFRGNGSATGYNNASDDFTSRYEIDNTSSF